MSKQGNDDHLALQLKALGNPVRLRIFRRLLDCCIASGACNAKGQFTQCVGDLGSAFELAPSTVSHHLKELRIAGLIRSEKVGKSVMCWVPEEIGERFRPVLDPEP
ncbi:MAG: helix-turn-helix domain-containing protein [Deltaproteobacteria bacterium]|nr:helix-turn-helix domain-containing protein [Deltaproteobacteria bacterium]